MKRKNIAFRTRIPRVLRSATFPVLNFRVCKVLSLQAGERSHGPHHRQRDPAQEARLKRN